MRRRAILLCPALVFAFLFSGCENVEKLLQSKTDASSSQEAEIDGPLLAQVNDWKIGLGDFQKRLQALEPLAKEQNLDINNYAFKKQALDELVRTVLLSEEAKARGLDKKRDIIEAVEGYQQTLLAQSLAGEVVKEVDVTEVEIENFYRQNKEYFKNPEQVRVREIVVNSDSEARDLSIRLLQGEDFSALARQYSQAPSQNQGGDLGYLSYNPDNKFKKFWEVVFALDSGETSSIFRGEDGKYYIVRVEDKKEGKVTPLVDIKEDIRRALKIDKENKEIENLIDISKQNAKVIINDDLLQ